jgi:hypothetical protein
LLERLHVDPSALGEPRHAAIEDGEIRGCHASQIVERAVEVVRAGLEVLVGPEAIDELLAVEDVPGRESERGEHLDRTSLPPGRRGNRVAPDFDAEPTKQEDARGRLSVAHLANGSRIEVTWRVPSSLALTCPGRRAR